MVSVATPIGMHDASGRMSGRTGQRRGGCSFDAGPEPDNEHQRFDLVCRYACAPEIIAPASPMRPWGRVYLACESRVQKKARVVHAGLKDEIRYRLAAVLAL